MSELQLNGLKPAAGSRRTARRVGRGNGSGHGKTCGRGHKGQRSRAGGGVPVGFEGGQMPLQRRLPKRGFRSSRSRLTAQVRLSDLARLNAAVIDKETLVKGGVIPAATRRVKVILSGELNTAVTVKGLAVTAGAAQAIAAAGGTVVSE